MKVCKLIEIVDGLQVVCFIYAAFNYLKSMYVFLFTLCTTQDDIMYPCIQQGKCFHKCYEEF